jgi:adenosine deaminase
LGSDDPGSFGFNELTVDYYMAFMAFGFDLADLKKIANNSIKYSSISEQTKSIGYLKFENEWNFFILNAYKKACENKFNMKRTIILDYLPNYGLSYEYITIKYKFKYL